MKGESKMSTKLKIKGIEIDDLTFGYLSRGVEEKTQSFGKITLNSLRNIKKVCEDFQEKIELLFIMVPISEFSPSPSPFMMGEALWDACFEERTSWDFPSNEMEYLKCQCLILLAKENDYVRPIFKKGT